MTILADPCGRCQGQVIEERDEYRQVERYCLQCGARAYLNSRGEPVAALTVDEERSLLRTFSTGKDGGRNFRDAQVGTKARLSRIAAQLKLEV